VRLLKQSQLEQLQFLPKDTSAAKIYWGKSCRNTQRTGSNKGKALPWSVWKLKRLTNTFCCSLRTSFQAKFESNTPKKCVIFAKKMQKSPKFWGLSYQIPFWRQGALPPDPAMFPRTRTAAKLTKCAQFWKSLKRKFLSTKIMSF